MKKNLWNKLKWLVVPTLLASWISVLSLFIALAVCKADIATIEFNNFGELWVEQLWFFVTMIPTGWFMLKAIRGEVIIK